MSVIEILIIYLMFLGDPHCEMLEIEFWFTYKQMLYAVKYSIEMKDFRNDLAMK